MSPPFLTTRLADDGCYYRAGDTEVLLDPLGGGAVIWPRVGAIPVDRHTGIQLFEGPLALNPTIRSSEDASSLFCKLFY